MKTILRIVILLALSLPLFCMKGEAAEPRAIDYARFKKATSGMTTRDLIRNAWRNIAGERYDSAAAFYSVAAARY